jgi:hypothetical protein
MAANIGINSGRRRKKRNQLAWRPAAAKWRYRRGGVISRIKSENINNGLA